jgi:hypothetical protein
VVTRHHYEIIFKSDSSYQHIRLRGIAVHHFHVSRQNSPLYQNLFSDLEDPNTHPWADDFSYPFFQFLALDKIIDQFCTKTEFSHGHVRYKKLQDILLAHPCHYFSRPARLSHLRDDVCIKKVTVHLDQSSKLKSRSWLAAGRSGNSKSIGGPADKARTKPSPVILAKSILFRFAAETTTAG